MCKAVLQMHDIFFWYGSGSGSADPCLYIMDPDPYSDLDPAIFVINLQDPNKNFFFKSFSAYYFSKVHLHYFSKINGQIEVTNSRNQGFFFLFLLANRRIWIQIRTSD
jgi:hypothetical protein